LQEKKKKKKEAYCEFEREGGREKETWRSFSAALDSWVLWGREETGAAGVTVFEEKELYSLSLGFSGRSNNSASIFSLRLAC